MNEGSGWQFSVKHFGNLIKPCNQLCTDGRIIKHNSQNINLNIGQPHKEIYTRKVYTYLSFIHIHINVKHHIWIKFGINVYVIDIYLSLILLLRFYMNIQI